MIVYLLCTTCGCALVGDATTELFCHGRALDCSPWSSDGRAWYRARVTGWRAAQVVEVANYRQKWGHAESLVRGATEKGDTMVRLVA